MSINPLEWLLWPLQGPQRGFLRDVRRLVARELESIAPVIIRTTYSPLGAWAWIDVGSVTVEVSCEMEFRDVVYVAAWPSNGSSARERPEGTVILGDGGVDGLDVDERRRFFEWLGIRLARDLKRALAKPSELGLLEGTCEEYPGWKIEEPTRATPGT